MTSDNQRTNQGGEQTQESRRSAREGEPEENKAHPTSTGGKSPGSDAAADAPGPKSAERPSAGTPDIERGDASRNVEQGDSTGSLVNDPVGAFKERP